MRSFMGVGTGCLFGLLSIAGCKTNSTPAQAPTRPSCTECTIVRGTVLGPPDDLLTAGGVLVMPRKALAMEAEILRVPLDADGNFEFEVDSVGPHAMFVSVKGHRSAATVFYADGHDIVMDMELEPREKVVYGDLGPVRYLSASPRALRYAKLQSGPLCEIAIHDCPEYAELRRMQVEALENETDEHLRVALALAYLAAREHVTDEHDHDQALALELHERLDPADLRWTRAARSLVVLARTLDDWDYARAAFEQTPDDDQAALVADAVIEATRGTQNADLLRLAAELREHPRAQNARISGNLKLRGPAFDPSPRPGAKLPAIEVETLDGPTLGATIEAHEITLVHFWATWHAPSKDNVPALGELHRRFGDKGFHIVSLAADDSAEVVTKHLQLNADMPWAHAVLTPELREPLREHYDLGRVPFWFLVDREGTVVMSSRWPPLLEPEQRLERLEAMLAERLGE